MLKFSANLSFLYTDRPFEQRLEAAAKAGFKAVEYMTPYEMEPEKLKDKLQDLQLTMALFNSPAGDWANGERGLVVLAGRDEEFAEAVKKTLIYAEATGCARVNYLAGINKTDEPCEKTADRFVERFRYAADALATIGVTLLLEHINPFDMPGYFVPCPNQAIKLLEKVGRDNVKLQYDIYHAQRVSGELVNFYKNHKDRIDHIQVADNPGRHQPGTGEINYKFVLDQIDAMGFDGWIGLEYIPVPDADNSYGWINNMGWSL